MCNSEVVGITCLRFLFVYDFVWQPNLRYLRDFNIVYSFRPFVRYSIIEHNCVKCKSGIGKFPLLITTVLKTLFVAGNA
jgi:hypothetical protein